MKRHLVMIPALIALSLGSGLSAAQADVTIKEASPGLLKKATYPGEKAVAMVRATLPKGIIDEAEVEEEHGKLIYSFDVRTPGKPGIDEVNISALDGTMIGRDHEGPKQETAETLQDVKEANAKVTMAESVPGLLAKASFPKEKAIAKIEAMFPLGTILSATVEQEGKTLLYAFDVSVEGKKGIEDVDISATTGKLLHKEHLSPQKYAKEKLADEKRAAAQQTKVAPR